MIKYLKTAISDFKNVASPFASSLYVARKISAQLKSDYKFVVEYGPGDGVITKELLKVLPADGKLVAIEINENFIRDLSKINDARLVVIDGDVRQIARKLNTLDLPRIDAVISGIPFSFFKKEVRQEIITDTFNNLRPGGVFVVYQITRSMLPMIKKAFGEKVKLKIEFRNFMPFFIMIAEK